ncbi:MAG: hypothetical protein ACRDZO_23525 [Egibacteraceae bacterium]
MSSMHAECLSDAVDALGSACDRLATRDLAALDGARLQADVEALARVGARVAAERLRCVAEVAARAVDPAVGTEEARRLLRTVGCLSGGQALRQVRLATALAGSSRRRRWPATRERRPLSWTGWAESVGRPPG